MKIKIRIPVMIILVFLFPVFSLFSQSTEPEEVSLELPPLILEIADIETEQIEAFLPTEEEVSPLISIILPEAGALRFDDNLFSMMVQDTYNAPQRENAFFSEGAIGVGTRNHILGDITLYKVGSQPRFNLRFYHEQWDGFQGHQAGEGFSQRDDGIVGDLSYAEEEWKINLLGSFKQDERGLQGQSDFSNLSHRSYIFNTKGEYRLSPLWTVRGGIDFHGASLLLTGDEPVLAEEINLKPEASISVEWSRYKIAFSGVYDFISWRDLDGSSSANHSGDLYLTFNAELPAYIDLGLGVGVAFRRGGIIKVPFSVEMEGQLSRSISFYLEGGYKPGDLSYINLWENNPFLEMKALLPAFHWYADLGLSWFAGQYVTLDSSILFQSSKGEVALASEDIQNTGLFSLKQVNTSSLTPAMDIRIRILENLILTTGWKSRFLDTQTLYQGHNISFGVSYESKNGSFGSSFTGNLPFYPEVTLPDLKIDGFYRFSEGVLLMFELRDLLAPFLENGRSLWAPYLEPGFAFVFKTQISL